jgi:NAD(P)-dependent dehydrogenase (short-subunit alcohol dehydrogenase family)/acyl carrier protein
MDMLQAGTARAASSEAISETVVSTIAEVTRYPRSVLRLDAELEDELGIESVKRAEILSVLTVRLALPPPPTDGSLGRLKTIADLIALVEAGLAGAAPAPASHPVIAFPPPAVAAAPVAAPPVGAAPVVVRHLEAVAPAPAGLAEIVIATIAEVTRYPRSVLRPDAELEDELGIESVKRAEIVAVLGRKLGIAPPSDGSIGPLRTIADVVAAVEQLAGVAPVAPSAPIAPASVVRAFEPPVAPARPAPVSVAVPSRRGAGEPVFAGKVALVTGSGHGLGKALARHLARLGASVVINSFHSPALGGTTVAELTAEGRDAIHVWGSVADAEHLDQMFDAIEARHGHLDFLVHNASDVTSTPLTAITAEEWHRAFRTEVVGLHQAAMRAAALMAKRGGGKIVTLTHPAAQRCFENQALLGTVKAAVESLTRYLAVELGPRNIQVNAVCAGPVRERMQRDPDAERLVPRWAGLSPGRLLPDEAGVASAVAFLLSEAASQMAGATIVVDGGISLSS